MFLLSDDDDDDDDDDDNDNDDYKEDSLFILVSFLIK